MLTIVVSDIFGKTPALERLSYQIQKNVVIFDPYDGKLMDFKTEKVAYAFFTEQVGLGLYTEQLKAFIAAQVDPIHLIGFSVGASAIWNLSAYDEFDNIKMASCYYGSQIRRNAAIEPVFPMELIFPTMEKHFSINEVIERLSQSPNLVLRQTQYYHGFMNELSVNFDRQAYKNEIKLLSEYAYKNC